MDTDCVALWDHEVFILQWVWVEREGGDFWGGREAFSPYLTSCIDKLSVKLLTSIVDHLLKGC